jgi:hypothetical protein
MKHSTLSLTILLFASILLLYSCPPKNMQLNESLFYFNNAYRWKRTDVSADFVHPVYKHMILKSLRNQEKELNISDLEIEDIFVDKERGVAMIKIRISYLMSTGTILKEESVSQYWIKEDNKWFFVGQEGSERLNIPVPPELKSKIYLEDKDAGTSDN